LDAGRGERETRQASVYPEFFDGGGEGRSTSMLIKEGSRPNINSKIKSI
jgi:hypothetical protein